ncbi:MAG: DUF2149 domain-containing protein [Kiritimatiellae bacterium]|jgi:hypothetical protein|nr:DUF2149 domain-containing protein [Kiritimatiellia bacterium]
MRALRRLAEDSGDDPLQGVANFFDLGIVFALGFMVALISYMGLPELFERADMTLVKNPGRENMEVIRRDGKKLERYRVSPSTLSGEGIRLGTAYQLPSGEVVYIPEAE